MDFFMPAERVLYDRSYYFSDEAVDDYNEYIADRDGVNVDVVSSLDFFMNEVWKEIDYAIDNDLFDEISRFDRMLRDLKCGDDPEHPTEISVVAKGTVERWDRPSRGLVVADSLLSLVQGTGSADALKDCQIDRIIDTNGELHIEASHHDGSAYLDVRLISGISYDAKGFKLGGEKGGREYRRGRCRGRRRHQAVGRFRKDRDMAEKYEPDEWEAVVCNGFTAVNVLSSSNVEELGWDYTEMELDPTGTCGLFEGMLLDWDDDTPDERREHEEYFPDAFTVGARILVDDWDHELSNDEVRSRCFLIIEHADQFTDHDTGRDWLCESTLADFSEVEAMTFFQNLTLMEPQDIAELGGRPIIPSAGPEECRAAVLAFNQKMIARRRERELGDTADPSKVKKTAPAPKSAAPKREQAIRGLGRVDFSGLGYGWGMQYYPDSLSVDAIGIDYQSGERNAILNFSPITHAIDLDGRKFFCHETTMGYDRNADSWSGATIGPDFWTFDGEEAREFAENIGFDRLAARACAQLGIDAPGLKGREALPIPKAVDVAPEPGAQAEAAKAAAGKKLSGEGGGGMRI